MTYIPDQLRRMVTERAESRCEYCRLHQDDSLYTHEIDHIIAEKHRGATTAENLCLSCLDCNRNKGTDFASFDPETGQVAFLFHPRNDVWGKHFKLDAAKIIPLTPVGRVTVFVLDLNAENRIQQRLALSHVNRYP